MGAWGVESFANDTALDWLDDLKQADEGFLIDTLAVVVDNPGYPELDLAMRMDVAHQAIAAAEVVAALAGRPAVGLPTQVGDWARSAPATNLAELRPLTLRVIAQVLRDSRLAELWYEEDQEPWRMVLQDLLSRLSLQGPADPCTSEVEPCAS